MTQQHFVLRANCRTPGLYAVRFRLSQRSNGDACYDGIAGIFRGCVNSVRERGIVSVAQFPVAFRCLVAGGLRTRT